MRHPSRKNKLLFSTLVVVFTFVAFETAIGLVAYYRWWGVSFLFLEDSGRTIQFDSARGYRLTPTPSRMMRVTNGVVEYVATFRGNSQGFQDRDDFGPKRSIPPLRRIAVFGDSFTAGQNVGQNWPDRAEDLVRKRGKPVQFLNLAVYGGGLANWWSITFKILEAEQYEIDGVIFAVFGDDVRRRLLVVDHRGAKHFMQFHMPSWDPSTFRQLRTR